MGLGIFFLFLLFSPLIFGALYLIYYAWRRAHPTPMKPQTKHFALCVTFAGMGLLTLVSTASDVLLSPVSIIAIIINLPGATYDWVMPWGSHFLVVNIIFALVLFVVAGVFYMRCRKDK